jgi:sugar-specific transcriptional regulator TrmB
MSDPLLAKLSQLGFSEYEAKVYLALLKENPASGYQIAKQSGVPRSMVYEVIGKLNTRGALMTYRVDGVLKYAPVPPGEFLDNLRREQETLITSLQDDLSTLVTASNPDYIWNLEGNDNILAKAAEMILNASNRLYIAITPRLFPALQEHLASAAARGVNAVIYTTTPLNIDCCKVIVAHVSEETLEQAHGLALILVVDGGEVLIGEWMTDNNAHASWTSNPLMVFIAEHHLRTDLYLPQLLACLGDDALNLIAEEDRELFARAMESKITC